MILRFNFHQNPDTLHVGTLPPASYFIPYQSAEAALTDDRNASDRLQNLCGKWSFRFYPSPDALESDPASVEAAFASCDEIDVPRCWQTYHDRGYDPIVYSNLEYPFPVDPPYVPYENPVGVYRREVTIRLNPGRRKHLVFEGVSSCFYLYVNGVFAGYSQVSHSQSVFDVTDLLTDGVNRFLVFVFKWCDGSYLEDQDMYRLSGIFREVYLLDRAENGLADVEIRAELDGALSAGTIRVETGRSVSFRLYDPDGACLGVFTDSCDVAHPALWSAETPRLYRLVVEDAGEFIPFDVGFRRFEIRDRQLLLNGRRITLRGVNRHDSDPITGWWVTPEQTRAELRQIRRMNANCIRTSHYPNDPRFLQMCDRMGFYVVNEADLETHGMGYDTQEHWDWERWSSLSNDPAWREAYLDRARLLYERDKNHPCVMLWSLGNESGAGVNHRAMAQYIRSRNADNLIHYENSHKEFKAVPPGEDFSDISDVESRMYASPEYIREYLSDPANTKPFFMCEYLCGFSAGQASRYMDMTEEFPNFTGGCLWQYAEHAINIGTRERPRMRHGLDYGREINNGARGLNGLVHPDRTPLGGYYELKKCYEPVRFTRSEDGIAARNRLDFRTLDGFDCVWEVSAGGKAAASGTWDLTGIAPGETRAFPFDFAAFADGPDCFLTVRAFEKADAQPWECAFAQFELGVKPAQEPANALPMTVSRDDRTLTVRDALGEFRVDRRTGRVSWYAEGETLLDGNFDIDRCQDEEDGVSPEWKLWNPDQLENRAYAVAWKQDGDGVTVRVTSSIRTDRTLPILRIESVYRLANTKDVTVTAHAVVREAVPPLPRFGLLLRADADADDVRYFGPGPFESYPDNCSAVRYGLYEARIDDMRDRGHVLPQESGCRMGVRDAEIRSERFSVRLTEPDGFALHVSRYSARQLRHARHADELTPEDRVWIRADSAVDTLHPWDAGKDGCLRLTAKQIDYHLRIRLEPNP